MKSKPSAEIRVLLFEQPGNLMKLFLYLWMLVSVANAAPTVRDLDWHPACDGSHIEIVSDKDKIVSVTTSATHFAVILQWTIHYLDGQPVTAEFREHKRGRIQEGDKAGEPSGVNPLKRIETFKAQEGRFDIPDKALQEELANILTKVAKDG
jgi:hypothetical protein